jgi:hypothetical protein
MMQITRLGWKDALRGAGMRHEWWLRGDSEEAMGAQGRCSPRRWTRVTYEADDTDGSSRSSGLDNVRLAMGTLVSPAERRSWVQARAQAAATASASALPATSVAGSSEAAMPIRGNGKNEIRRAQPKWPVDPSTVDK